MDRNPPIESVLKAGILPRLRDLLKDGARPQIQLESCWAITNIASGTPEQTQAVVESGSVPLLVELLQSNDASLQEQAIWGIANIAGDRVEYRDGCISVGTVEALRRIVEASLKVKAVQMTRLGVWGLSNMCRGKPYPDFEKISPCLPSLSKAISLSNDTEVLADTAWALSYLTDNTLHENIVRILSFIDLNRLVSLLAHPSTTVHVPILRVIGNLVSGDSDITRKTVSAGALAQFKNLIISNKKGVRKETLWAISNVCADSQFHVQSVIDCGLMDRVCEILQSGNTDTDLRKEAVWSICNASTVGNREQIRQLVTDSRFRVIELLTNFIQSSHDRKSIKTVLDSLYSILLAGSVEGYSESAYSAILEECGGLTIIEDLQQDESEDIYRGAIRILENFFNCEDEEDANLAVNENKIVFNFSQDISSPSDVARSG
jgi:hypothetical protein